MKLNKICRYDERHILFQDKDKNLILFNEETLMLHDLKSFIQPERLNPETAKADAIVRSDDINETSESSRNDLIL